MCVCLGFFCGRHGRRWLFSFYKEFSQIMCKKILKYSILCFLKLAKLLHNAFVHDQSVEITNEQQWLSPVKIKKNCSRITVYNCVMLSFPPNTGTKKWLCFVFRFTGKKIKGGKDQGAIWSLKRTLTPFFWTTYSALAWIPCICFCKIMFLKITLSDICTRGLQQQAESL